MTRPPPLLPPADPTVKPPQHVSLGFRLSAQVLAISLFMGAVLGGIGILIGQHAGRTEIESNIHDIRHGYLPGVVSATWELADERLASELKALRNIEHVAGVRIDDGGRRIDSGDFPADGRIETFPLEHPVQGPFGSLTVVFDQAALRAKVWSNIGLILLTTCLPILVLALALLLLFHRLVTRHLRSLALQVQTLGIDNLDQPITLRHGHRRHRDEIDDLVTGLENMRRKLREQVLRRERVEWRLEQSERNYQEVFNAIGEAVFIHDGETGAILDVNERACALYRGERERLLGASGDDLSLGESPFRQAEGLAHIRRCLDQGPQLFSWRARRLDGELFWAEVFLRAGTLGGSSNVLATVRDVTSRRATEEELAQFQKMDSIGQMAGGIAHDFNNMLGGITGAAELLARNLADQPAQQKYIDIILRASERAADLTSKMLAFSRRGVREHGVVDLHVIISDALAIVERSIDRRIVIERRLEAGCSTLNGDRSDLQNVIINLCLNARDAMPEGGSLLLETSSLLLEAIDCEASPFDLRPGPFIRLSVRDTGQGMGPEIQRRIFDPFFTTKEVGKGTGLGLSAVYGIVSDHGGSITVSSQEGQGSVFHILLPADCTLQATASEPRLHQIPPGGSGRLLLIDDEEIVRLGMQHMLESLGYEVLLSVDGKEAIQRYRAGQRFDLVLLDMIMPRLNGTDTFRQLRALDPQARVILCSGFARNDSVDELMERGLCGFLRKPVRLLDLAHTVHHALHSG